MAFGSADPYLESMHGNLLEYLREHDGTSADNMFSGSKHFFIIKDAGLMIPCVTLVRVSQSPIPDLGYVVNADFLLESAGQGEINMSAVGAERGVYDPKRILKDRIWSIHGLNLFMA